MDRVLGESQPDVKSSGVPASVLALPVASASRPVGPGRDPRSVVHMAHAHQLPGRRTLAAASARPLTTRVTSGLLLTPASGPFGSGSARLGLSQKDGLPNRWLAFISCGSRPSTRARGAAYGLLLCMRTYRAPLLPFDLGVIELGPSLRRDRLLCAVAGNQLQQVGCRVVIPPLQKRAEIVSCFFSLTVWRRRNSACFARNEEVPKIDLPT